MEYKSNGWLLIRSAIFLGLFLMLHYFYDFFPNIITELFSGTDESLYQHLKIGFYAYLILFLLELIMFRKQVENLDSFIFSRLLSTVLIPWMIFILWFIGPAVYGKFTSLVADVIYANIITYSSLAIISVFERWYEQLEYPPSIKILILVLIGLSILEFTIFTFNLPWHDMFVEPIE